MNIFEIWELSNERLQTILTTKNQSLSDNRNFDRTVVAIIFDNEGRLDVKSSEIVQIPMFDLMMSNTKDYKKSLVDFNNQYKLTIIQAGSVIFNIENSQKLFSEIFDELNLCGILFD